MYVCIYVYIYIYIYTHICARHQKKPSAASPSLDPDESTVGCWIDSRKGPRPRLYILVYYKYKCCLNIHAHDSLLSRRCILSHLVTYYTISYHIILYTRLHACMPTIHYTKSPSYARCKRIIFHQRQTHVHMARCSMLLHGLQHCRWGSADLPIGPSTMAQLRACFTQDQARPRLQAPSAEGRVAAPALDAGRVEHAP